MPSKSGCSPVDLCRAGRPPRSAWRTSVVDKVAAGDCSGLRSASCEVGDALCRDGGTVAGLSLGCTTLNSARPNGQCNSVVSRQRSTHNGHCVTGNAGARSRDTMRDHVTSDGSSEPVGTSVESETPGCFACITLCHVKDSHKSSKSTLRYTVKAWFPLPELTARVNG